MKKLTILTSLYNCKQYLPEYFNWVGKLEHTENIELLILHNEPKEEEVEIINSFLPQLPFIKYVVINKREPLYKTWNRGIQIAQGEYITNWNVDDIIFSNSLYKEIETLDNNPQAGMTYGDYYNMYEYGISAEVVINADFRKSPSLFFKKHQISCFPMWRKSVHLKVGFFDEQFTIAADFDFQIKVARSYDLVKTPQIVGMYLHKVPEKLSSNSTLLQTEENVIYLRYGIYDCINYLYLKAARQYNIHNVLYNNNQVDITKYFPAYKPYIRKRYLLIILSLLKQPRNILAYMKHEVFGYKRK